MRVMGAEGDMKIIWDPEKAVEVEQARASFNDLTEKGYNAYSVGSEGKKGDRIRSFDPKAEKIIIAAPMAGG